MNCKLGFSERQRLIKQLVKWVIPASDMPPPPIRPIGSGFIEGKSDDEFYQETKIKAHKLKDQLKLLDDIHLRERYNIELAKVQEISMQKRLDDLKEVERLAVWNRADAVLDYEYWAKMPYWSLKEAVMIVMDKNPKVANIVAVCETSTRYGMLEFHKKCYEMYCLAERASQIGKLQKEIIPTEYLVWAKTMGYEIVENLEDAVLQYRDSYIDWKAKYYDLETKFEVVSKELDETQKKVRDSSNGWGFNHDTRLLKIIRSVVSDLWEGQAEVNWPKKEYVLKKINLMFPGEKLSQNAMNAIDLVTRHDKRRNTAQSKKR